MDGSLPVASRVGTALLFAALALASLELGARILWDESASERNAFGYSLDAGFEVHDGLISIVRAASRSLPPQQFPVRKPPGSRRIVLVGDSILRGRTLDSSVSSRLHGILARCGIAAEVWNLSSPGYGSLRKRILVQKALEFEPDLIVYHANFTTEYEDAREWERKTEYASWHPRHWLDRLPFIGRLRLSKLERLLWNWEPQGDADTAAQEGDLAARLAAIKSKVDAGYWIPRMIPTLEATTRDALSKGVPMVILTRADLRGDGVIDGFGLDGALRPLLVDSRLRLLSTREVMSRQADPASLYSDGSHWTAEGHRVMARAIARPVIDLLGTPASPSCADDVAQDLRAAGGLSPAAAEGAHP